MALTTIPASLSATALTLTTAAQPNITSVGTLTDLTVSGDLTVDTTTLKVDSSSNRVGIGAASPSTKLHIGGTAPGDSIIRQDSTGSGTNWEIGERAAGKWQIFEDDTDSIVATFMSTGNVGIGTTSPASLIDATGAPVATSGSIVRVRNSSATSSNTSFGGVFFTSSPGTDYSIGKSNVNASTSLSFRNGNTGASLMDLDSSGNLLVGTTNTAPGAGNTNAGVAIRGGSDNRSFFSVSSNYVAAFNRNTNDGPIVEFNKDGSGVGSIGVDSGDNLYIGGSVASHGGLYFGTRVAAPIDAGTLTDAVMDLGTAGYRFKDLYLSSAVRWYVSGVQKAYMQYDGTDVVHYGASGVGHQFWSGGNRSVDIDSSGNLLVGLTSISDATSRTYGNAFSGSSSYANWTSWGSGTHTNAAFRNGTNQVGSIVTTSTTTTYNTSSDQRLKENIVDAPSASDDIDAIQVRSFDWKADGSHQKYGMVAQELQSVAPEAVSGDADSDDMMGVDYAKLVPMLVKEIQSLRARVAQLEAN